MKKRIFAAIICLALVFSLVPAGALASETEISVDDYAVILQSYYEPMTDTAYVKLGFTDNSQKIYPVGKTYLKNKNEPTSSVNEYNRPMDFQNNSHFGIVVKYSIASDGTVDLSAQDFGEIFNGGSSATKYYRDGYDAGVSRGAVQVDGRTDYPLNDDAIPCIFKSI